MKYALNYLIAITVACNSLITSVAVGADHRNFNRAVAPLISLNKLGQKLGPNVQLKQFVNIIESNFNTPKALSVSRYVTEKTGQMPINFTVYKNIIRVNVGGETGTIQLVDDQTILFNGVQLYKEDFANPTILLSKIQKVLKSGSAAEKYSLWQVIFSNLIPNAQAALEFNNTLALGVGALLLGVVGLIYLFRKEPEKASQINITNVTPRPRRPHNPYPYYQTGGNPGGDPFSDDLADDSNDEAIYTSSVPAATSGQ